MAVLGFEALVVLLAVAPALALVDGHRAAIVVGGVGIAALCVLSAASLRRPVGLVLGSVTQLVVLACGLVLPVMYVLGGLFAVLWVVAVVLGRRVDGYAARRQTARTPTEEPGSPP
jgi:hypothetical protein